MISGFLDAEITFFPFLNQLFRGDQTNAQKIKVCNDNRVLVQLILLQATKKPNHKA